MNGCFAGESYAMFLAIKFATIAALSNSFLESSSGSNDSRRIDSI